MNACWRLSFPVAVATDPVIFALARSFRVSFDVASAGMEAGDSGWVVLAVEGPDDEVASAREWLARQRIEVDDVGADEDDEGVGA